MQFPLSIPNSPVAPGRLALTLFLLCATTLSVLAGLNYPGNALVFATFAVFGNVLLLNGFRRGALYFDTFIGIFFWLGFFLKLAIRLAFMGGQFSEPVGAFDGSGAAFDKALTLSSLAFSALLLASLLRERFFVYPTALADCSSSGLYRFYCDHRKAVLISFLAIVILIAASNAWLGIYQRGMIARTVLPFGLNGVYKWLIQFGLASISALVIRFEIARAGTLTNAAIHIPLLEAFFCNVSLLSRGMILNVSALAIGAGRLISAPRVQVRGSRLLVVAISFAVLMAASVFAVNYLRAASRMIETGQSITSSPQINRSHAVENATGMSKSLFIDRWVGMEGVLAVTSSKNLGWDLWRQAWREKYDVGQMTLYDSHFIDSPYREMKPNERFHFVSLPGLVAFLFYSGSSAFLFAGMMLFALVAALLEIACYRWCGKNPVLCSLFAQVIAFRLASFGYVPAQSHLLFGSLFLNGALIWGANVLLTHWQARKPVTIRP